MAVQTSVHKHYQDSMADQVAKAVADLIGALISVHVNSAPITIVQHAEANLAAALRAFKLDGPPGF